MLTWTTKKKKMVIFLSGNCAHYQKGGWWYNSCAHSNLNGVWYRGGHYRSRYQDGVYWAEFRGGAYSLKKVVMMIRPNPNTFHWTAYKPDEKTIPHTYRKLKMFIFMVNGIFGMTNPPKIYLWQYILLTSGKFGLHIPLFITVSALRSSGENICNTILALLNQTTKNTLSSCKHYN